MYPSCSQYAKLAFQRYTGFRAVALTADRMMRCGHDLKHYDRIPLNSGLYYYDLLSDTITSTSHYQSYYKPAQKDSTFIDFLINKRRFEEARLELWREIYEAKENKGKPAFYFTIGKTYFMDKAYDDLIKFYTENSSAFARNVFNDSIKLLLTKAYLYKGKYQAAQISINNLSALQHDTNELAFLQGLVSLHLYDMQGCERAMKSVSENSRYYQWASYFSSVEKDFAAIRRRSPKTASFMSVIVPGSGYLVSGKRGTALTAIVINSLFAFIAIEAFRKDNYALGIGTSVIGSGWYIGSVIGSYNSVVKWNNAQQENFIKQKTLPINLN